MFLNHRKNKIVLFFWVCAFSSVFGSKMQYKFTSISFFYLKIYILARALPDLYIEKRNGGRRKICIHYTCVCVSAWMGVCNPVSLILLTIFLFSIYIITKKCVVLQIYGGLHIYSVFFIYIRKGYPLCTYTICACTKNPVCTLTKKRKNKRVISIYILHAHTFKNTLCYSFVQK